MANTLIIIAILAVLYERIQWRPFSAARWHARPRDRWQIAHDLIRRAILSGMSRSEVVALLGKPEYESVCSMAYQLRGDRWGDKLRIRLGRDDRVFKSKLEFGCD